MSETVYFDRWGGFQGNVPSAPAEKSPYIISEEGNVKYIRFEPDDAEGKCVIQRVTETLGGSATETVIEHAYGAWADRATLTYYPINEAIPVDVEEPAEETEGD